MGRTKNGSRGLSRLVERRLAMVEGCERRGESITTYAAGTGQSARSLYEAKRAARRAGLLAAPAARSSESARRSTPRFAEAVVTGAGSARDRVGSDVAWRLRLPGGAVLESTTPLDAKLLGRLMTGPEGRS